MGLVLACSKPVDQNSVGVQSDSWSGQAQSGRVRATLRPEDGPPRIGAIQNWIIELRYADGRPVYPARITIDGGMPEHGHGLPTQPEVTDYLDEGRYRMEGFKLSMAGRWLVVCNVSTPHEVDQVRLELEVQW